MRAIRTDEMRDRIAAYPFPCGGVEVCAPAAATRSTADAPRCAPAANRRGRRGSGAVVARTGLGRSWRLRPLIMPLDQALEFIATKDFFWINA